MGKVLVAVGTVWLVVAIVVAVFYARSGFDFAVSFQNGISQRQAHLVLLATIAVLALGWLIPLSAGMMMLRRR